MTVGIAVLRRIARLFDIHSFADVVAIFRSVIHSIVKEVNIIKNSKPLHKMSFHLN